MDVLNHINQVGQSLWYDNIQRLLLLDGTIERLITAGKIKGITSNPTIFQKAISESRVYDESLKPMAWAGLNSETIFWEMAVEDIQKAAELFLPVYLKTEGRDGFVSLEVNPLYAYDTQLTLEDARRLWNKVARKNLMIKIPATKEGLPAIRSAISEGINVNVTLIFSLERYREVMEAYINGLEDRQKQEEPVDTIASVASFFVSRVDTKIDGILDEMVKSGKISRGEYGKLAGKAAIANGKLAYRAFKEIFHGERFDHLKKSGAQVQRPLWASTSTKNPAYRDTVYVEELMGPETVNTVPPATLAAFFDHGQVIDRLSGNLEDETRIFTHLKDLGISIETITRELEEEGVKAFSNSYRALLDSVELRRKDAVAEVGELAIPIREAIARLENLDFSHRFHAKDPSLWTQDPAGQEEICNRMNWIHAPADGLEKIDEFSDLSSQLREQGFTDAVLLGMGGSSLAPEVLATVNAYDQSRSANGLGLTILDSTDPQQVAAIEEQHSLEKTVFLVASKSGTTGEINALMDYFWYRVEQTRGNNPGRQFIAITDPGTKLDNLARSRNFNRVINADPKVGGRNSALTAFGLAPAAICGVNVEHLLENAQHMAELSLPDKPLSNNPGMALGVILGAAAQKGRDKVTLIADGEWKAFGDWLEQLIAESSGKENKGIVPISKEPELKAQEYRKDRLYIYLEKDGEKRQFAQDLLNAGHPVLTFAVSNTYDLGSQFYMWEVAVATACAIIGVNSFDQPDVQDAKTRTLRALDQYRVTGKPVERAFDHEIDGIKIYTNINADGKNPTSIFSFLTGLIQKQDRAEYIAVNAFLPRNQENENTLQVLRKKLLQQFKLATTLGFGPRYLHSTGQLHKGGPDTGIFVMITSKRSMDIDIPAQSMSFGVMQRAQALGDLEALEAKGRKVIWLDLPDLELGGLIQG